MAKAPEGSSDGPAEPAEIDRRGLSDEMRQMLDQSERNYEGWNPELTPQVVGTIADITPDCDCGGFGPHNIIFIDLPNGDGLAVHCFHTTLRSQVDTKIKQGRISAGDLIAISHLGTRVSQVKGHADMNMYRVITKQKMPDVRYTSTGELA
jgi:hypothetical protein